jgi:hypothetical protein
VWEKMEKFAKNDPDILSDNHQHHINKVFSEPYAYIQDKTSLEVEMSKQCDVDMIKEAIMPLDYSVGMQNNSAYVDVINAE